MAIQTTFQRYEMKYLLTVQQKQELLQVMSEHMELDEYGRTTIFNVYFDTENYRLIRNSIEKPTYKEKLRIRSYQQAQDNSIVFVELKKKYKSIVYKRRIALNVKDAMQWCSQKMVCPLQNQISKEIDYFIKFYETLKPTLLLSYEREAYFSKDHSDFRVTFDDTILCRQDNISLQEKAYGTSLLKEDQVLMEIKSSCGLPMWMVQFLSEHHLYKTSFSKYGTAYQTLIFPKVNFNKNSVQEGVQHDRFNI